jgi:hypothetical protein
LREENPEIFFKEKWYDRDFTIQKFTQEQIDLLKNLKLSNEY